VLTQTAQINARQFSSLQPDLRTWDPRICDFVEALTNMFMNFLFAVWIHNSRNLRWPLIKMLLLITMSRQDLTSVKFYWKVNSKWYQSFLWKAKQFLQCTTWGALMCGPGSEPRRSPLNNKSGSARHCSPIPKLKQEKPC